MTESLFAGGALAAEGAKPTDPQIAHIACTAGVIDINAAKQAMSKASNKEVKAFAADMVRDHEAVNKQALDLVLFANEVAYHKDRQQRAGDSAHSVGQQSRAQGPAANRPEDLSGPSAARRARCRQPEVTQVPMLPRRTLVTALAFDALAIAAHAATSEIVMENLVIAPAQATTHVGDTVEWINKDIFAHTATAGNGDIDVTVRPKKTVTSV